MTARVARRPPRGAPIDVPIERRDGERPAGRVAPLIAFEVPVRTVNTLNAREHWAPRARRARQHREAVLVFWKLHRCAAPPPPLVVTLTRRSPRRLDEGDNLAAALKHVRDGVADCLGIDDGDPRVEYRVEQRKGPWGIEIRIEVK